MPTPPIHFAATAAALLVPLAPFAAGQAVERVSVDASGTQGDGHSGSYPPALSADGRHVVFDSGATNLVPGDTNGVWDVFARDLATGAIVRISVDSSGVEGDGYSIEVACSADGRFVAFASTATNLVPGDTNGSMDVFVRDRDPDGNGIFDEGNGVTTRVSVDSNGGEGDSHSYWPSLSADGRFVAFESFADNLVAGDTNGTQDVFVHDRVTGVTTRASVGPDGREGDGYSYFAALSGDGTHVTFTSQATNLVWFDTNGADDVFVRDLVNGATTRVSVDSAGNEAAAGGDGPSSLSFDGSVVAFWSYSDDLVPNDTNGVADVFCHDRATGATTRVSVDSNGGQADNASYWAALSADGALVLFTSLADNLVVKPVNGIFDVHLHERASGRTIDLSSGCPGPNGNGNSNGFAISADGSHVAFASVADNLVSGDTNLSEDVFVVDRAKERAKWDNYDAGFAGTNGVPGFTSRADPVLGTTLTLDLENSRGVATAAFLFLGLGRASIPTGKGGTLLVDGLVALPLALPAGDLPLSGSLPEEPTLCGTQLDLQAIEADPGAAQGLSFTAGLELLLGY